MKFLFFIYFITFLCGNAVKTEYDHAPAQKLVSPNLATNIFNLYTTTLAELRDSYDENPLNGITYSQSINGHSEDKGKNYSVLLYNSTIKLKGVENPSYDVIYSYKSAEELELRLNHYFKDLLEIISQVEIKSQNDTDSEIAKGFLTYSWNASIVSYYDLNANTSFAEQYKNHAKFTSTNTRKSSERALKIAMFYGKFEPKLDKFITQAVINDTKKKLKNNNFSKFSKNICSTVVKEAQFDKIIISKDTDSGTVNVSIGPIVIERMNKNNFTGMKFDNFIHDDDHFWLHLGKVKVQFEYKSKDTKLTKTLEYVVDNFQICLKIAPYSLSKPQVTDVLVFMEPHTAISEESADTFNYQHAIEVTTRSLRNEILNKFNVLR